MNLAIAALIVFAFASAIGGDAAARTFEPSGDCIGMSNFYRVKTGESLIEIARYFDLGFNEIVDSNPQVAPYNPAPGIDIEIPTAWVLPRVPEQQGIVINLAEMRLYFFTPGEVKQVMTFPVGVGEVASETPLGVFSIVEKMMDPTWHVPLSIRKEQPHLLEKIGPGPANPLGSRALRLSVPGILIHGTNKPWGQGRRVSRGCIRLYPEDIVQLYAAVPVGSSVTIVNQAVKIGTSSKGIFAEVHKSEGIDYLTEALRLLRQAGLLQKIDPLKLKGAIYHKKGVPVEISR